MGCGSSQVNADGSGTNQNSPGDKPYQNGTVQGKPPPSKGQISNTDTNANREDRLNSNPVPKSVAFTVNLEGKETENKLIGLPPPRLKRLAPLDLPKLTAAELAEKQRQADEKREEQLKRRQSASVKSSRRRKQLLEAQKFAEEQEQSVKEQRISQSIESAGKSREARMNDIKEKQRIREERAKRAREKVKKLNQLDQELELEVEKDDDYNAEEVDSWLDGDNNNNNNNITDDCISADTGERIYSGRTSPKKRYHGNESSELRRGISANTIDSFDNAYNRKPPSASKLTSVNPEKEDDFFDS